MTPILYLAGPLFTRGERDFNLALKQALAVRLPQAELVLPQEQVDVLLPDLKAVVAECFALVARCDVVLANLDGPDADSGTCVELGYGKALGKTIIGYRTDFRGGEVDGVNAMLRHASDAYVQVPSPGASVEQVADAIVHALAALRGAAG